MEEEDGDCVVDFKWVSVSAIVSAGDEGIDTDVLLQKRFADGENTGEFDTATEHDIVFLFSFRVVFVLVFSKRWVFVSAFVVSVISGSTLCLCFCFRFHRDCLYIGEEKTLIAYGNNARR